MRKYLHTQWRPRRAADPLCMQLSCGGRLKNLSIELLSTFNKDQLCFFFGMENASPNRRIMPMRLIYNALRGRARCHTQLITIDVLPHNSARLFCLLICSHVSQFCWLLITERSVLLSSSSAQSRDCETLVFHPITALWCSISRYWVCFISCFSSHQHQSWLPLLRHETITRLCNFAVLFVLCSRIK